MSNKGCVYLKSAGFGGIDDQNIRTVFSYAAIQAYRFIFFKEDKIKGAVYGRTSLARE
jgi:hypothetical protein